jgi:predicted amidophosphoribosyltransferase
VKVRDTAPQPALSARERRANLRGAFACRRCFAGEHVAIVDDVLTTGATADALAHVLRQAGAGRISAWSVALAPDPRR